MKIVLLLSLVALQFTAAGQYTPNLPAGKLSIGEAEINGSDVSYSYQKGEAFLAFYLTADSAFGMANVFPKKQSQSYGPIYAPVWKDYGKTEEGYPVQMVKFKWDYANTYDDVTGTAHVEMLMIQFPNMIVAEITIFPENNDKLVFRLLEERSFVFWIPRI